MIPFHKHSLNLKQQTQKALRIINQHQKIKSLQMLTMLNIQTEPSLGSSLGPIKSFEPSQKTKVQLLPNSLVYYKMQLHPNIDPKIIIRQFRGGPVDMFLCFDKLVRDLEKSPYHFVVKDQVILKFATKYIQEAKTVLLVFRNGPTLTHFVFRIDYVRRKKVKSDANQEKSSIAQLEQLNVNEVKLMRSKSSKVKLNRIVNFDSQDLISLKPEQKLKRISQLKSISLQKKQAAMKRIENIEITKQKNVQALKIVASCKKMFNTYQELVSEEDRKKLALLKAHAPMLYAIKYCFLSSMFFHERERNMRRVITIKSYEKKFLRKIRRAYRQTKALQPDRSIRQLESVKQIGAFLGNCLNRVSIKRSVRIAYQTFSNCFPGFLINLAMNESSNYRRIVRILQRRWKIKFEARTTMLLYYCEEQLKVILKAFPHLQYVQKQYRDSDRAYTICIEYQKETANKMKDLISAYRQKLIEIEQYEEINKEIRKFNQTALKKKMKQQLEIPKRPAFPQFRFFRDLLFMKSMIRGELEVLFRKFKKKNPQIFQQKPTDQTKKQTKKHK